MDYIPAKTLVNPTKDKSWFGTDYTMNIYKGCMHGCIYCDSRSDCYHVDNFDTVRAKKDALLLIRNELRRKAKPGVICTGAMSDPYNAFEKELCLTRHALELIEAYEFGVAIATKSDLITRDIDILTGIQAKAPVICKVTLTTLDDELAKKIEPHAPLPSKRLKALKALSEAGLFTGILLMPVLPFITDTSENILAIVEAAHKAGVHFIYPSFGVTLRNNQRKYYYDQLDRLFPGLKAKYIKGYGTRYQCGSPHFKTLYNLFKEACQDYKLLYQMSSIIRRSRQPYTLAVKQLSLFD